MTADSDPANSPLSKSYGEAQYLANSGIHAFQTLLLENLPQGILLLSPGLQRLYTNQQAQALCQELLTLNEDPSELPAVIAEVCGAFLEGKSSFQGVLIHEVFTLSGSVMRLQVQWLASAPRSISENSFITQDCLLVTVEDCDTRSLQDRWLEQKRYGFTDREIEVWQLIQQQYSYQDIAHQLAISLNTVKTHVKNIYAKRRAKGMPQES